MSEQPGTESAGEGPEITGPDAAARRRLAEVFGDVLPESTRDDAPGDPPLGADDRWYLENRPPHH
jgi:hypothetical protein